MKHFFFSLALLSGLTIALNRDELVNFDEFNPNLDHEGDASYRDFVLSSSSAHAVKPQSGQHYVDSYGSSKGNYPANGTLVLNSHAQYGHLNTYYYACYAPSQFTTPSSSCNFSMVAHCYDKNNNLNVFTLVDNYRRTDNVMQLVDLVPFYKYYANLGYFAGTGSGARCLGYDFHAVPATQNGLPINLLMDTFAYNVTGVIQRRRRRSAPYFISGEEKSELEVPEWYHV